MNQKCLTDWFTRRLSISEVRQSSDLVRGCLKIRDPFLKSILDIHTPTTKAVGSELVKKYQPTALVVGDSK